LSFFCCYSFIVRYQSLLVNMQSKYTVVQSKKAKSAVRKSKKSSEWLSEESDEYDAALASTPELIARGKLLITDDNPTGQAPGLNQSGPGMLNLLTRLQTYASILKKDGLRSPEIPKKLTWTFPPGRKVALANAAALKVAKANDVKPVVSGTLELVEKERSTKQFAMSTVQQPKGGRKPSARARYCPIDKFGSYTSGTKKFASSALEPVQKDGTDDISSESSSDVSDTAKKADNGLHAEERKQKKARISLALDDALMLTGFPLLPNFEEEYVEQSDNIDIVEEMKVSDNIDIDEVKLHEFLDDELDQLTYGHNSRLFYDCVKALPEGAYVYLPPTGPKSSVFQNAFSCPKDCLLPTLQDADSVMSGQQQRSCKDAETRCRYHYLCQKTFWGATSIDELKTGFAAVNKDYHMDVVMIGEGFTNSVWGHTNTLQYDVQKLWFYLNEIKNDKFMEKYVLW